MALATKTLSAIAGLCFAVAATACGSADDAVDPQASTPSGEAGMPITIVASTNVYGSIAETIGGNRVSVTSLIADPSQDPHSYEANTQNQLALSKAALVIENGGGYDDVIDTMLDASGGNDVTVLNAVKISGKAAADGDELNEHVWYDLPTVTAVAGKIADALAAIDPAGAEQYRAHDAAFAEAISGLESRVAELKSTYDGTAVAITEPVPLYLLQAAGLVNRTPPEFSEAIEEDSDVSPLAMKETLDLFTGGQVAALVYNEQTSGPATERLIEAAEGAGVPTVAVTETLPANTDFRQWMSDTIDALTGALAQGDPAS